ncbi:MAG: TetR/AcrR family transcriptional regulator [Flavobacteriales bacterium]|nr:TetR/AcrR family transcriptional regulator [Flavobacteriales bacterium]MCC6937817.1 TetR/AcrR family transcriptional regulator [Flavobacteriales bacterium]
METTDPEKRILKAARTVFERDGFNGARMQHIADEAGISKASLHYYFRSKEKLFDRIFDAYMDKILPLIGTWDDDTDEWRPKVRKFVRDLMGVFRDTSLLFMVQELHRDPKRLQARLDAKRRGPNRFIKYYERLRKDGLVRDTDPRSILITLQSVCGYPTLAAPMLCGSLRMKPAEYTKFLMTYADDAADHLIRSMEK